MEYLNAIIKLALMRDPGCGKIVEPEIEFSSGDPLGDYQAIALNHEERCAARDFVLSAFRWCSSRFPMLTGRINGGIHDQSITRIVVGKTSVAESFLSASSMQAPGEIQVAISDSFGTVFRFGSIIAHENTHQALYVRESISTPVRQGSLGYSPWKRTLRPGRWLWHSWWTFSCQFALVAESALSQSEILEQDPGLISFLADMAASLFLCIKILEDFEIVAPQELVRCADAKEMILELSESLMSVSDFKVALSKSVVEVERDYIEWGCGMIEARGHSKRIV